MQQKSKFEGVSFDGIFPSLLHKVVHKLRNGFLFTKKDGTKGLFIRKSKALVVPGRSIVLVDILKLAFEIIVVEYSTSRYAY